MISTERNESEADRSQPLVRSTVEAKGVLQEALFACLAAATAITWPFVRPPAPLNLLELQSTVQYSTLLYSTSPTTAIVFLSSSRVISSTLTVSNALYVRHLNNMRTRKLKIYIYKLYQTPSSSVERF